MAARSLRALLLLTAPALRGAACPPAFLLSFCLRSWALTAPLGMAQGDPSHLHVCCLYPSPELSPSSRCMQHEHSAAWPQATHELCWLLGSRLVWSGLVGDSDRQGQCWCLERFPHRRGFPGRESAAGTFLALAPLCPAASGRGSRSPRARGWEKLCPDGSGHGGGVQAACIRLHCLGLGSRSIPCPWYVGHPASCTAVRVLSPVCLRPAKSDQ